MPRAISAALRGGAGLPSPISISRSAEAARAAARRAMIRPPRLTQSVSAYLSLAPSPQNQQPVHVDTARRNDIQKRLFAAVEFRHPRRARDLSAGALVKHSQCGRKRLGGFAKSDANALPRILYGAKSDFSWFCHNLWPCRSAIHSLCMAPGLCCISSSESSLSPFRMHSHSGPGVMGLRRNRMKELV